MACPYFQPTGRLNDDSWLTPPRLPLGDPCTGVCRAHQDLYQPQPNSLRTCCNRGYARGICAHFPLDASADALRFSLASSANGVLVIHYIYECNHSPLRHGRVEFHESTSECVGDLDDPIARAQLHAFVQSYLRRRAAA